MKDRKMEREKNGRIVKHFFTACCYTALLTVTQATINYFKIKELFFGKSPNSAKIILFGKIGKGRIISPFIRH